jgi:hypothetical protein
MYTFVCETSLIAAEFLFINCTSANGLSVVKWKRKLSHFHGSFFSWSEGRAKVIKICVVFKSLPWTLGSSIWKICLLPINIDPCEFKWFHTDSILSSDVYCWYMSWLKYFYIIEYCRYKMHHFNSTRLTGEVNRTFLYVKSIVDTKHII